MRLVLLLTILLAGMHPSAARADGFGWYVCSVEWHDFQEALDGMREEAQDLLAGANTSKLRSYLQLDIDSRIVGHCRDGADESPVATSFYAVTTVQYALRKQNGLGIADSYFRFFSRPPEALEIDTGRARPAIDPYYFVLAPEQVAAFHNELVALNKLDHPAEFRMQLKHMEAVTLKTLNDHWGEEPSQVAEEYGNGRRGLIFYGHD